MGFIFTQLGSPSRSCPAILKVLICHTDSLPAPGGGSSTHKHRPQSSTQDLSHTPGFSETTPFGGSCATPRLHSLLWRSSASRQTDLSPKYLNEPSPLKTLKYQTTHTEPLPVPVNNQFVIHKGPANVWVTRG